MRRYGDCIACVSGDVADGLLSIGLALALLTFILRAVSEHIYCISSIACMLPNGFQQSDLERK